MAGYLKAGDTISGQEGKATAIINGVVTDMFYVRTLEATAEKTMAEVRALGRRGVQHKGTGWAGSGTLNVYYVTTELRKLMLNYIKNGVDTYFTISVVNNDPTSTVGRQTVILYNCNINSLLMAKLDTESDVLDEDIDFTFDDVDIPDSFVAPVL